MPKHKKHHKSHHKAAPHQPVHHKHHVRHTNAKAVSMFMILIVAVTLLILFANYKDNVMASGKSGSFMLLVFVGMGLLITLLYLIAQSTHSPKKKR